jgi:hypothetical protein
MFVSASGHDYHLQANSPAIDSGATESLVPVDFDGVSRPQGKGFDVGAYEIVFAVQPAPPTDNQPPATDNPPTPVTPPPTPVTPPTATDSLVANWTLVGGTNTTATDSSASHNDGQLMGEATWGSAGSYNALSLDGVWAYVAVPESPALEAKALTVTFWMAPQPVNGSDSRVVAKSWSWDVKLNGPGMYPQFTAAGKYAQIANSSTAGQWQQVAFTFQNGVVKGYVNGAPATFAANTFTGGETLPTQPYGLNIGTDSNIQNYFKGMLRDVRLYNRALTDAEIASEYAETKR